MIIATLCLLATAGFAQSQFTNFDDELIPEIRFEHTANPPEYMPDTHTRENAAKVSEKLKTEIANTTDEVWIGLEGIPSNLRGAELINKLHDLDDRYTKQQAVLAKPTVVFKHHVLATPRELLRLLDSLVSQINPKPNIFSEFYDILINLKAVLESRTLLSAFNMTYANEQDPEILAPGAKHYKALAGVRNAKGKKAHFFGLEQGDHYTTIHAHDDVSRALIGQMQFAELGLAGLQTDDTKKIFKPLEQALKDIEDEARQFFTESTGLKSVPLTQDDPKVDPSVVQRSNDWVQSYQDLLQYCKTEGLPPPHVLLIGGHAHQDSLISAFKKIHIDLRVLSAPQ